MALFYGVFLLALGLFLGWLWWEAMLLFLQGLLALAFVIFGLGTLVVALAGMRAKRQIEHAKHDAPSDAEKSPGS